jgi:nucleoside-diphosphate-sugar epimerase
MQSYFQDKKVLLTGGSGFIGSHLAEQLLSFGAKVTVVDNFLTGHRENLEGLAVEVIDADVSQPAEKYLPTDYSPDVVLHFASPASPVKYQQFPIETYSVNSFGTHYLLQHLLKVNKNARFLFASTSEVYGDPLVHPQSEEYWGNVNPNGARSYYDEAKRLGETICGVHHGMGLDVRIVRIFNTYGPRIDVNDGRVIPNFLYQALTKQPLTIYGDGSQTRSYCYVSDLVEGILQFAAHQDLNGETINLGNPEERTVLETAQVIQSLLSAENPLPIEFKPLPKDDPHRRKPDISKAQRLLQWQPKVSFEDGLLKTVEYFRNKKNIAP